MRIEAEYATEVFPNQSGGITIKQEGNFDGDQLVSFDPRRARIIAAELIRLADAIDAELFESDGAA